MTSRNPRRIIQQWVFLLLAVFAAQGCSDDSVPTDGSGDLDPNPDAPRLSVYLTDAPGDVDAVWVQVNDVVLVGGEGGPRSVLDEPSDLIELTQLTDSAEELASSVEVEPGTYSQIRFIIGGAVLQSGDDVFVSGGAEHPEGLPATGELICPSCAQTGIKVILGGAFAIEGDVDATLLLDFDVNQSFGRQAGRSGKWVMRPVIHAMVDDDGEGDEDGDGLPDAEGEIEGTVELGAGVEIPACGGEERTLEELVVTATSTTVTDDEGEPLVFSAEVEGKNDGSFEFEIETSVLDVFDLGIRSETEFDGGTLIWEAEADPAQVTLDEANDEVEDVVYTVTSVSCEDEETDTGGDEPSPSTSNLDVFLKDAPGDVDAVWVQVDDVVLVGGEGGPRSVLDEPSDLIELTQLTESSEQLADDVEVEAGTYAQIRFIIGGAVLQSGDDVFVTGGAEHPEGLPATGTLLCPSCAQTGIKVVLGGEVEIEGGVDATLLLDFDVNQSFGRRAGRSGMWVMRPVIHATLDEDDGDDEEEPGAAGAIRGAVELATDDAGEPLEIPVCGGEERTLEELVVTATTTTVTDDEGEALVFTGAVQGSEDGYGFEIETSVLDAFDLGIRSETEFDGETLVWEAEVDPAQVTLDEENPEAEGVVYTVTSVSCEGSAP